MEHIKLIFSQWITSIQKHSNKYVLTAGAFLLVVLFLDRYSWINRFETREKIRQMEGRLDYLNKQKKNYLRGLEELEGNKESLEKYARERYYMKAPNEEIFIIREENK